MPKGYAVNVCNTCSHKLRDPYLSNHGARLYRRPSNYFREPNNERVQGLHAIDALCTGDFFLYPGLLVDEHTLNTFQETTGYEPTHAYAKGGPKDRGMVTVILGQYTPAGNPYNAGHFINAIKSGDGSVKRGARDNCIFGKVRVTDVLRARHPEFAAQMRLGEMYPVVRVVKPVVAGAELVIKSYGASFWARMGHEDAERIKVTRCKFLRPHERKLLLTKPLVDTCSVGKRKHERYCKKKLHG